MAKVTGLRTWRNGEIINARDYVYERNQITSALNTNDDTLIDHETRIATAEGDITALEGRMTTAETDIDNLQAQEHLKLKYYAKAHESITKGEVVQFYEVQGDHYLVKRARQDEVNANPKLVMGIAETNVNTGDFFYIIDFGFLEGVDTKGQPVNSFVWFDSEGSTPGAWTITEPTGNKARVLLAVIVRAETSGPANNGKFLTRVTIEPSIQDIQGFLITNSQEGDVLRYDASTQTYQNSADLTTAEADIAQLETDVNNLDIDKADLTYVDAHINNTSNPHAVTKAQVGLGNVNNTSDLNKPISTATQSALDLKADLVGGKVPAAQLPSYVDDVLEVYERAGATPTESDWFSLTSGGAALTPEIGKIYVIIAGALINKTYRWGGTHYSLIGEMALGTTAATAFPGDRGLALEGIVNTTNQVDTGIVKWNATSGKFESSNTLVQTSGGNVGIGTLTPATNLEIKSITAGSNPIIRIQNDGTATGNPIIDFYRNSADYGQIYYKPGGGVGGGLYLSATRADGVITFLTGGTNETTNARIKVLSNGRVGIGTTAPDQLLHVAGAINLHSQITWFNGNADINGADTNLKFRTYNGTALTEYMRLTSAGRLGIGSTNPTHPLHISLASGDVYAKVQSVGASTLLGTRSDGNSVLFNDTNDKPITFWTTVSGSSTEKMRILANGNVGIGTTSPNQLFEIKGSGLTYAKVSSATNGSFRGVGFGIENDATLYGSVAMEVSGGELRHTAGFTSWGGFETFYTNGAERMRITSTGNVGIGTTAPAVRLHVVGGTRITGQLNVMGDAETKRLWIDYEDDNDLGTIQVIQDGVSYKNLALQPLGNNVGIGTRFPTATLQVKSDSTTKVPLIVDTVASHATLLQEWRVNGTANSRITSTGYFSGLGLLNFSDSNNGSVVMLNAGTKIERNIADTNPALIVNLANASATGNIQVWQKAGSALAWITQYGGLVVNDTINNGTSSNQGYLYFPTTGPVIQRNIADTNPALIVNLQNASATGNIQVWQKGGTAQAYVSNNGYYYGIGIVNISSSANSTIDTGTTGTLISRNVNDANVTLKVRQFNASASGRLQEWIQGSTVLAYTDNAGDFFNFTGTYGTISDLRVKENIMDARDYTEDLMKLRVVKYSLKKDQEQEATKLGFIAQEVEQVFPNMVQTTETEEIKDLKSIKMSVLIPMLVKTIQELNKRIEELEKK